MIKVIEVWSLDRERGLEIISDAPVAKWPAQGRLIALGVISGCSVYRFERDTSSDTWVCLIEKEEVKEIEGAQVVAMVSLQPDRGVTLMLLGPTAFIRVFDSHRQFTVFYLIKKGEVTLLPASMALAMGLVAPDTAPEVIPAVRPVSAQFFGLLNEATDK